MTDPEATDTPQRVLPWMQRTRWKGRCLPLLVSLVVLLALYPYLGRGQERTTLVRILFSVIPLAGVYAVSSSRWTLAIASLLAMPFLAYQWLPDTLGQTRSVQVFAAGALAFYAFTTITILAHVLRGPGISDDKLYGAISVYLLLGLTFAMAYGLMQAVDPGTFVADLQHDPDGRLNWSDLLYFSFVTLTTLGYGDITPVSDEARSLAFLEAATGVMYVAVLVARLVGAASRGDTREAE